MCKIKEDKKPLYLVADIQAALGKQQPQSIIAYTDGSTTPLAKNPNSGMAIVITDQLHRPLWSGGGVVRADGNNFIPELAAAAIVIKACPKGLPLTLRMDSKAAIGAISKGLVSERRRVRAPGRLWLNFCRKDFLEKKHHIRVDHVSSHKGTLTKEQQGNDMADVIANEYRRQGERMSPCLYFMEDEEQFLLQHKNIIIQGDMRVYLKSLEKDKLLEVWKSSAPKQAKWASQHPIQVRNHSKNAWKWAIDRGEGIAWIYYIFAISQWLPTNHRLYYGDKSGYDREKCKLCLLDAIEDTEHLLICPAFCKEHLMLQSRVRETIIKWHLPFAEKTIDTLDNITCRKWFHIAKQTFSTTDHPALSHERLWILIMDF